MRSTSRASREQRFRFRQVAVDGEMGVDAAEIVLHLLLVEMHGGRDDVARMLAAQLDDVFAEIRLDRLDAVGLEEVVEARSPR